MKSKDMNALLVEHFPELKEIYIAETSWQEGHDTGSHVIYGDVLTPHLLERIQASKQEEVIRIFNFIEFLLELEDEYAEDVVSCSVLESVAYLIKDNSQIISLLRPKSKEILFKFL